VVIDKPLVIVIESTADAVWAGSAESCSCTVKVVVPVVVGFPVMAPAGAMDKPVGKTLPLASENVYDGTPPVAARFALYEFPTTPLSRLVVVICKLLATVIERVAVTVCGVGLESFACAVKFVVPGTDGVPLIRPAALIAKPAGNTLPLASENV
jgi:hypothetical protein